MSNIRVNIAVCGKFHILNYIDEEALADIISKVYVSATQDVGRPSRVINNKLKEILVQLHGRVPRKFLYEACLPRYHDIWAKASLRNWVDCELFHVLSHGASIDLIKRAKAGGAKILLEAVNTHPVNRMNIINNEIDRLGIGVRRELQVREYRICKEAEMADFLLAPTGVVADSYSEVFDEHKRFIIPYCANVSKFKPSQKSQSDRLKVLCVGQVGLRKGQLHLVRAVEQLNDRVDLTLVGMIDHEVSDLLHHSSVAFTHIPRIESSRMPEFMAGFDVYVLPSLEEGLSLSVLEAMASGLAVIASRASGAEEVIESGSGILLENVDSASIKNAIESVLDYQYRSKLIDRSLEAVRKTHNWKSYASSLRDVYFACLR
jgi:glycosyltransferase involved in cell wall biosynthesis